MGLSAAFFDVDETLLAVRSMFRFLQHHRPDRFTEVTTRLRALAAAGWSRSEVIGDYYRVFAGEAVAELAAAGREWFSAYPDPEELFLPAPLEAFRWHRDRGDLTVLVSGSFEVCLAPIAAWLGADLVHGTRLAVRDGRYTGEVVTPMIGPDKADVANAVMAAHGLDPALCTAYGDHSTDLPMLLAVGTAVVVGEDPVLVEQAAARGWTRLPAAAAQTRSISSNRILRGSPPP